MPPLLSHWDGLGWQTPNISDMLDLPTTPLDRTGHLRDLATQLVRKFASLGTPVRLKDMEVYPTHTRYHLLPDKIGGRGSERQVTQTDLEAALPRLLAEMEVGTAQLVALKPDELVLTLFVRSDIHAPLKLRDLLERESFTSLSSYMQLPLGMNLAQEPVTRDLAALGHLLIMGGSASRLQLMNELAVSLMLFNSPGYLRIGLVGDDTSAFRMLSGGPHVLGNIITNMTGFRRLLDGLLKHCAQRKRLMETQRAASLDDFNKAALSNKDLTPLPRLVVFADAAALAEWENQQGEWLVPFHQLLTRGPDTGIHVVLCVSQPKHLPERLAACFPARVILRAAFGNIALPTNTPTHFVDAVIAEGAEKIAVEIPILAESETVRAITYWQNMKARRNAEKQSQGQPVSTGNTGLLTLRNDMLPTPNAQRTTPAPPALQETTDQMAAIPVVSDQIVSAAGALAAYLGWLGHGPLQDVLDLEAEEAAETLRILRSLRILEEGEGPIWRFRRLAKPPSVKSS